MDLQKLEEEENGKVGHFLEFNTSPLNRGLFLIKYLNRTRWLGDSTPLCSTKLLYSEIIRLPN